MANNTDVRDFYIGKIDVVDKDTISTADASKTILVKNPNYKKEQNINLDSSIKHLYITEE